MMATEAGAIGSLVVLQMLLFWRAALLRGILIHSDLCYFFEPVKGLLHESVRAGRLPLWSPCIMCGYPMAAEGQIAAFYPISLLISCLLPSPGSINWLIIVHLLLAAVSMYLLTRLLGLRPFGSWVAGLTFSFSGYLLAHLHHLSLICAASWLPVVILFAERAWRGPLTPNAVLAALAWGACALCGHPQTLFHVSLLVIFWLGWRWLASQGLGRSRQLGRAAKTLALIFVLGAALAAVQLLLTKGLSASAPHGERGSLAYVTSFSLLPKHLFGLLSPNWQGTPAYNTYRGENYYWEYVLYIGLVPLGLALVGSGTRRGRVLAGLALVGMVLALAQGNPLYRALRFVPGFADFRVPARFSFLFTFAAALLAGHGWERLSQWRWLARGRRRATFGALLAALVALDLLWFDRTLAPLSDPRLLTAPNPVAQALASDQTWWRVLIVPPSTIDARWVPPGGWAANPDGWVEARLLLPANVPQSFGLRAIGGYVGFTDPQQSRFFQSAYIAAQSGDLRLLSLVGTRYLALPPQVSLPGLEATSVGPFALYRNPEAFERAFVVGEAIPEPDPTEALLTTVQLARSDRLKQAAVVQGEAGGVRAGGPVRAELEMGEPRPERVVVRARSDSDCLLVLNERWDRGWRASLDGRRAPLLLVDTVLMGTVLPRGAHVVEFIYQPPGLLIGRAISLAALALCAVLLAASSPRRQRR